jgi:hypothetical protein
MSNRWCAKRAVSFLALVSFALAGCRSEPAASPPASAAVPREDFRVTDSTLSLLEPHGARCVWAKLDAASRKRLAIATFEGDCRGGRIALAVDQKRGAVWFDPAATSAALFGVTTAFREADAPGGIRPRLFAVDLGAGSTTSVPLPSGALDLGFDPQGRIVALTVQEPTENG